MQVNKKVSIGVGFAQKKSYEYEGKKFEADIKNGDIVTIIDGGTVTAGSPQYGSKEQIVFKIKTRNGDKAQPFNQTSMNNMIDSYGGETNDWIGKEVRVYIDKVMGKAGEGFKFHVFIAPLGITRDEETGIFSSVNQTNKATDDIGDIDFDPEEYPEINVD